MFLNVTIHGFNETGKKSDHLDSKHSCPLKVSLSFFIGVFVTSLKKKLALRISLFSLTRKKDVQINRLKRPEDVESHLIILRLND